MSRLQGLKVFINQRLTAAVDEIFGHVERTITEYEEELDRRHRKLLDVVLKPEIKLRRAECPADVQRLSVSKEEVPPEQQDWSPSLDQEDPPEPPHIKEEQEELWTSQEGGQLRGLEEADITRFTFKSEDDEDEEKPQSSQLHQSQTEQMETEADGGDCGGPGPARNSDPDRHLEPVSDDKTSDSSETEDSDRDWRETRDPQSGLNSPSHNEVPVSGMTPVTGEKLLHSCSECGKRFGNKTNLKIHMRIHTGEHSFSCLVCGRIFAQGGNLRQHMAVHTGGKRLRCSLCDKRFTWYKQFKSHKCVGESSQLHQRADGEDCGGPEPARNSDPDRHLEPDTDDMIEDSSETEDSDDWKETREPQSGLNTDSNDEVPVGRRTRHTGDKPLSYTTRLKRHTRSHTGEKSFSCSVCSKEFSQKRHLTRHMAAHTWEKPFSCRVCDRRFTSRSQLQKHECDRLKPSQLHLH